MCFGLAMRKRRSAARAEGGCGSGILFYRLFWAEPKAVFERELLTPRRENVGLGTLLVFGDERLATIATDK
jgi:hypothetical protein